MSNAKTASIRVRINEIRQLFNSMDPSPFHQRDLDPQCEEFIVSWARELPLDQRIGLEIRLDSDDDPQMALRQIAPAVHSHFARETRMQSLRLRRRSREARTSLIVGVICLTSCIAAATFIPIAGELNPFSRTLSESLVIAGWVAMWHPLEALLYGLWPVRRELRLLERLADAEVTLTAGKGTEVAGDLR
jgi:hypothetical protein